MPGTAQALPPPIPEGAIVQTKIGRGIVQGRVVKRYIKGWYRIEYERVTGENAGQLEQTDRSPGNVWLASQG